MKNNGVLTQQDYGIQEMLKQLNLKDINPGACTGTKWLDTKGDLLES